MQRKILSRRTRKYSSTCEMLAKGGNAKQFRKRTRMTFHANEFTNRIFAARKPPLFPVSEKVFSTKKKTKREKKKTLRSIKATSRSIKLIVYKTDCLANFLFLVSNKNREELLRGNNIFAKSFPSAGKHLRFSSCSFRRVASRNSFAL